MNVTEYVPYQQTGYFTRIVADYLNAAPQLRPFYSYPPNSQGIQQAIDARRSFTTPRKELVAVLEEQYQTLPQAKAVSDNIQALLQDNCFTITTAHQPNIFTGPLYCIYKIMHAIKLADELNAAHPAHHFVPVYYMGSEDADLEELGHLQVDGKKYVWHTRQTGAVGRMKVDKQLLELIEELKGQIGVWPHGMEWIDLLHKAYQPGKSIQQATLELMHDLFGMYGLVILVPDHAGLKKLFQPVVEKELIEGFSHIAVEATIAELGKLYKVQAGGREVNMFYLTDQERERIEMTPEGYAVKKLQLQFTRETILQELAAHPERFSANVILRGVFQEFILPNLVFIGGGGELAYWLELKGVFESAGVPYPVLMLRDSFVLLNDKQYKHWTDMGFTLPELFLPENDLLNKLAALNNTQSLHLQAEIGELQALYRKLSVIAGDTDPTLSEHVVALETKAVYRITELEKKIQRAARKQFATEQSRIQKLRAELFPGGSLQERKENAARFYAKEGRDWLQKIYAACTGMNNGFGVVATVEAT